MSTRNGNYPGKENDFRKEAFSEEQHWEDPSPEATDEAFPEAELEESPPLLTRETKIGLAVILVLFIVLGAVLAKRVMDSGTSKEGAQATAKAESPPPGSASSENSSPVPKPSGEAKQGGSQGPKTMGSFSGSPPGWGAGSSDPSKPPGGGPPLGSRPQEPPSSSRILTPSWGGMNFSASDSSPTAGAQSSPSFSHSGIASGSSFGSLPSGGRRGPFSPLDREKDSNPSDVPGAAGGSFSSTNPLRESSKAASSGQTAPSVVNEPPVGWGPQLGAPHSSPLAETAGGAKALPGAAASQPLSPYVPPAYSPSSLPGAVSSKGGIPPEGGIARASEAPEQIAPQPSSSAVPPSGDSRPSGSNLSLGGASGVFSPGENSGAGTLYQVRSGDTYWSISEKFYGTGRYSQALAEYNRARVPTPEQLPPGVQLWIPPREELEGRYPHLLPPSGGEATPNLAGGLGSRGGLGSGGKLIPLQAGEPSSSSVAPNVPEGGRGLEAGSASSTKGLRVYIVQEGDTLYEIARYLLGKPTRWVEIYELNKEILGEDFEHLRPGLRLAIPPADATPPGSSQVFRPLTVPTQ